MKPKVLIIDDEEHIRRFMRLTLEAAGYGVGEASNGSEALSLYGDGSAWEVVILDQRMPGIDGIEVLRTMRAKNVNGRIIMATAFASIELAVEAMKLGATDFMRKPTTPEILRNAVAAALERQTPTSGSTESQSHETEPDIRIITMNGFTILNSNTVQRDAHERRFVVRSPSGSEHEVLVQIDEEAIAFVQRMTRRELPPGNSFWTTQAQRLLSDYLWKEGKVPPTRKLTVKDIDRDDLPIAARWHSA